MSTSAPIDSARTGARPKTTRAQVDPRGQRFAASITTVLFAVALLAAPSALTVTLLALQLVVFGIGAFSGPARTPYAWLFKRFVRPRLGPPTELEDAAPPRFAQGVGLAFAAVSLIAFLAGLPLIGCIAAGMALAAAFLNAAFSFCLGCEMYLLITRARTRTAGALATR